MPELPEVETIRRGLKDCILNKKITQVKIECAKSMVGEREKIVGREIIDIDRRGKALILKLSGGMNMMIHLRMTGQLIYVDGNSRFAGGHPNENFVDELPNGQTRIIFCLENGGILFFNDQRKFGFCKILSDEELKKDEFLVKLGKEPWEMSGEELYEKIHGKKICIKAALLDQEIMAGLGNIYADETLWMVGVNAKKSCSDIGKNVCNKIVEAAKSVMEKSLDAGGSTIKNYVKADGSRGDYLELFVNVYGREGMNCRRCGSVIMKTRVAGRGTFYCPKCQEEND